MEKINAIWEKANLGVDCIEIRFSQQDTLTDLHTILDAKEAYQVLKIPSGRVDLLLEAQKHGFQVIENSIQLKRAITNYQIPQIFERFANELIVRQGEQHEVELLLAEVKTGNLFTTDRIYLDPAFTSQQAGQRYYNWMHDLIRNGATLNVIEYKRNIIGFALNKKINDALFDATFGAMLNGQYSGMGFSTIHTNIMSVVKQNGTHIRTSVSSNNLAIFKLHLLFDFTIVGFDYVLVKHM